MTDPTPRLVDDASTGSAAAVEALLDLHLEGLRRYVARRAGRAVLARESGSDIVQSVCRELLEHLADGRFEYHGTRQFKQWLYTAALLKISQRRRYHHAGRRDAGREAARPGDPSTTAPRGLDDLFRSLTTPSEAAMRREQMERIQGAFAALPADYRDVILLVRVEGLPHREVAARLGIAENHSRVLLSRALARLAVAAGKA